MTELWARVLRRYRFKGGLVRPRVPLVFRRAAHHTIHRTRVAQVSAPVSIHVQLSWPQWMPSPVRRPKPESPAVRRTVTAAAVRLESRTHVSTRALVARTPLGTRAPLRSSGHARAIVAHVPAAPGADRSPAMRDAKAESTLSTLLRPVVEHRIGSTVTDRHRSAAGSPMAEARLEHSRAIAEMTMAPRRARPLSGIVTPLTARRVIAVAPPRIQPALRVPVQLPAVQGAQAPAELVRALSALYRLAEAGAIDVILLVRGGGSIEDLWAFNDEQLARTIVQSPVPLICGVGHETDFTIADFCADVRAPTPTAAAELAAQARDAWLAGLERTDERLRRVIRNRLDSTGQRLDLAASRLGRPLARMGAQHMRLGGAAHRLRYAVMARLEKERGRFQGTDSQLKHAVQARLQRTSQVVDRSRLRLELLDPRLVLERGYALLTNEAGQPVTSVRQTHPGQALRATLADGEVALTVSPPRLV